MIFSDMLRTKCCGRVCASDVRGDEAPEAVFAHKVPKQMHFFDINSNWVHELYMV